jgi:response regulator RpfG family c-di-GMP phosphodiesterase
MGRPPPLVARLSGLLAQNLHLRPEEVRLIYLAAPVHDVGKLVIPDEILLKQTPLNEGERLIMQGHTTLALEESLRMDGGGIRTPGTACAAQRGYRGGCCL